MTENEVNSEDRFFNFKQRWDMFTAASSNASLWPKPTCRWDISSVRVLLSSLQPRVWTQM